MDQLTLIDAVGPSQPNQPADVSLVQKLLNRHVFATRISLTVDGYFGARTLSAIRAFQKQVLAMRLPDGVVGVHGITIAGLQKSSVKPVLAPPPAPAAASGTNTSSTLTQADYTQAAATLQCEIAAIKAVAAVETGPRGAFDAQGRPTILFERHYFSRLTGHIYDKTHPDISARKSGGYGKFSEQYPKLDRAALLDRDAALRSASWGAFQIMGDNYKACGYKTAEEFVTAMRHSIAGHLQAFVRFIASNPKLTAAIRKKDWAAFAYSYNGLGYKKNDYDTKLATAYAQNSNQNSK